MLQLLLKFDTTVAVMTQEIYRQSVRRKEIVKNINQIKRSKTTDFKTAGKLLGGVI